MKIGSIPFTPTMVRANRGGYKTQTRRLLKPRKDVNFGCELACCELAAEINAGNDDNSPYAIGEVLWVREHWRVSKRHDASKPSELERRAMSVFYEAGGYACNDGSPPVWTVSKGDEPAPDFAGRFRPGMFMVRWASRLTLKVIGLKVERLQDISEADAIAEGVCQFVQDSETSPGMWDGLSPEDRNTIVRLKYGSAVKAYRHLWETINGADSWDANPWVIAPEFEVHHANIEEYLASSLEKKTHDAVPA